MHPEFEIVLVELVKVRLHMFDLDKCRINQVTEFVRRGAAAGRAHSRNRQTSCPTCTVGRFASGTGNRRYVYLFNILHIYDLPN